MTHEEMTEKTRAGLRWVLADVEPGTRVHELTDEEVEELARAAIRVIAPAVLEGAREAWTDNWYAFRDRIDAVKTRYEQ